jgi:hypothetical protein
VTLEQAQEHSQEANTAYDSLKKDAPAHRHEFLCDRVANKAGDVPLEAQKAASRLLRQERQCSDARHLKRVLSKTQGGAITRIKVMEDDAYVEKTDQVDVEQHTMAMCEA